MANSFFVCLALNGGVIMISAGPYYDYIMIDWRRVYSENITSGEVS